MGCLEFQTSASRIKIAGNPDYIVIIIDSPESDLAKAIDVALTAKVIIDGLELPSFVKTDGRSGLHVYIPLDAKSDADTGRGVAEFICKLIALKIPDRVSLAGPDAYAYGKVSLDFTSNETGTIVAPYSLVAGASPLVATPLLWDEINEGFRSEDFNHETIFKRLKHNGDPFDTLTKKKINAEALLERLQNNYGFLF
jgi:bifunctional non-homologous end joining protein LigD